ncbi:helix-turn-helix domain-containing protein [Companilactobacillus sp. RD055328]|uniref:helix-turn-helix domain-containing protein n=1 Tax=Companilactobacillus sp. RD055328 TaxID=2916634 RepID=UPI00283A915D|nr:helix-turn-helix domain-containing protein [Companilactobacillus sp. RD055328]
MSSVEASKRWNRSSDYVRQIYRKYPDKFPKGSIRRFGKQLVVTRKAMEAITGQTEVNARKNIK